MKKSILLLLVMVFCITGSVSAQERFNFDCRDTKLTDTIYSLARRAGMGVVVNGKLSNETVFMTLPNVTVEEALNELADTFNFNWVIENDRIKVSPSDTMTQTKRFIVKYAKVEEVKKELMALNIPEQNIFVHANYNSISVDGTPYLLKKAEQRIAEVDVPQLQVYLMAQMIQISRDKANQIGFQFPVLPTYDSTISPFDPQLTVTTTANRLINNGNVLARPFTTTLNGQEATVFMGGRVPIFSSSTNSNGGKDTTITWEEIGIKLSATPVVNDIESETITLKLKPSVKSVDQWISTDSVKAPQIGTREAETEVRIKSGKSIVIGGLIRKSDILNLKGIPGLMDIPVLGKLFRYYDRSKENSEVFILVTPYLLKDSELDKIGELPWPEQPENNDKTDQPGNINPEKKSFLKKYLDSGEKIGEDLEVNL